VRCLTAAVDSWLLPKSSTSHGEELLKERFRRAGALWSSMPSRKARPVTGWRSLIDWESTAQATSQLFRRAIKDDIDITTKSTNVTLSSWIILLRSIMSQHSSLGVRNALFRVFVLPNLSTTTRSSKPGTRGIQFGSEADLKASLQKRRILAQLVI
jgi:hypothetical protein